MTNPLANLSKRERQIVDILYRLGEASAEDVLREMPDAPTNSAVRALLKILENKGFIQHKKDGPRFVYFPTTEKTVARSTALQSVLSTFFKGSVEEAVSALLDIQKSKLNGDDYDRLINLIQQGRKAEEGKL